MKYLKFLSQENIYPLGDYFQSNFTFIVNDSPEKVSKFKDTDIKTIEVRLAGREDASLRAQYDNYELEPAFFTVAKNYIVERIQSRKEIKLAEKLFLNSSKYLNLDSDALENFDNNLIQIDVV